MIGSVRRCQWLTAALLVVPLGCNAGFLGSPDNPNGDDPPTIGGAAYHYTVSDEATGEVLASGCDGESAGAAVHAPIGSHLFFEILEEWVQNADAVINPDSNCSLHGRPALSVANPACWHVAEDSSLGILDWQTIPNQSDREPPNDGRVSGRGHRIWLEVVEHGPLRLEVNADCPPSSRLDFGLGVYP